MTTIQMVNEIQSTDDGSPSMMTLATAASALSEAYADAEASEKALIDAEIAYSWPELPVRRQEDFQSFTHEVRNMVYAGVRPEWMSMVDADE